MYLVHRVDIHEELKRAFLDPTLQGVPKGKLHLGQRVISCDFENTTLTLSSGETVKADLIIGADGIKVGLLQFTLFPVPQPTSLTVNHPPCNDWSRI
jgi:salicylate hydroxylase